LAPSHENDACNEQEREEEQSVPEYPPGVEGPPEKDVAQRFIDQVGQDGPESTEADEPPVIQMFGDREAQDEAEEQVAGNEHSS
jgi:hypothetical protein